MTSRICCLKRLGENHKKYKLIQLDQKDEVTIGRNPDVSVCILSAMISRCHALLKKNASGKWTITDNKSLNGVYINDKKLEPLTKYELQDGDVVQFGVKTSAENPVEEFVYKYYTGLKIKRVRKPEDSVDGISEKRLKLDGNHQSEFVQPCSSKEDQQTNNNNGQNTKFNDRVPMDRSSPYKQYKEKLDEEQTKAAEKLAEMEVKLKEMQQLLQEKDSAKEVMEQELKEEKLRRENQVKAMEDLQEKERILKQELEEKQEQLAREKEEMEAKMKEELDDILQVKEATLMENLEKQRLALLGEKKEVEERLKKELESEREKDKKLTEELMQQKQKLEKVIENKEAEQKMLENELNDTRNKKEHEQEEYLRAKEDILSNFAELMETELQCSICNELFVRATSLNCSHAFCSFCINQWMKVKKECPQCRTAITTHMRSIVLDSYIEKMVEQFSDELKESRRLLVEDRKSKFLNSDFGITMQVSPFVLVYKGYIQT
ncbi:E3 ubiquitin-protein ligase rnf8 [Mactra antiquata]